MTIKDREERLKTLGRKCEVWNDAVELARIARRELVGDVRELAAAGVEKTELAEATGLSRMTIHNWTVDETGGPS